MDPDSLLPDKLIHVFSIILLADFSRYVLGAGGVYLLVNLGMSRVLKYRKIRPDSPSLRQMLTELLVSLRTVLVFASVGTTIWLGKSVGILRLYQQPDQYGWLWFAGSIVALIVLHDAWFYWMHRLIHHRSLFRRVHLRHHLSHNPSPFTAYSFDIEEAVLTALYFPIALALMPVSELAAFVFTGHMILINALHHCGYEIYPRNQKGEPAIGWLTTTTHHDLHHARGSYNFGFYFTWWDRWMGTEHPHYLQRFARVTASRNRHRDPSSLKRKRSEKCWKTVLFAIIAVSAVHPVGQQASAEANRKMDMITGQWASEGYAVVVDIHRCGGKESELCGTLLWAWEPNRVSPLARTGPLLQGFSYANEKWRHGRLYHPHTGNLYRGTIHQKDPDTLVLEGCVARIFCAQQTWRRLQSLPHWRG